MFKNYFKTAYRNLIWNKNYTISNIAGLSIGVAVSMVIFIIIQFHLTFDDFHSNKSNIYRVLTEYHHSDNKDVFYGKAVPYAIPQALKSAFPQIEKVAPIVAGQNDQVSVMNNNETIKKFKENEGIFYTTPSFFGIFKFPLLAGTYESLNDPNTVLLSKKTAEKYFGDWETAIGKTIKLNNTEVLRVSGILASIPSNTQFQFKAVVSYGTGFTKEFELSKDFDGTSSNFGCFVLLPENVSSSTFNEQLKVYSKQVKSAENNDVQTIQPWSDVHFDAVGDYSNKTISHNLINILWLIAAFILLIACVNFINLSTAQAVNRAKEVGVRKVLGSNKWQLQLQFLNETFLIVITAVLLAGFIALLSLPYISTILELPLSIHSGNVLSLALFLLLITIVVTMLAGFYPSLVLAAFNPIQALKSKLTAKINSGISLRRTLVVFQFIIAQALIIGTLVILKQMNFFSSQALGFDKSSIVNIPVPSDSISNSRLNYLKQNLAGIKGIESISFSTNTPIEDNRNSWVRFNFDQAVKHVEFYSIFKLADHDYVPTYKLSLLAGRNLESSDTSREFLVNETLIKNLGMTDPQHALNKQITLGDRYKGNIVGVLKDFNTSSFRAGLSPMLITTNKKSYNQASIKLSAQNMVPVMKAIENSWNAVYSDFVFEYKFLDDKVAGFYKQENQLAFLYQIFAGIAIFLSCLGLYGLASFMAVQRIKEVGIRKVLGATASHIIYLFSKEFIVLIAIAFVIATPMALYFMGKWLQNYPADFRVELNIWIFIASGLASVLIALASVSVQAVKAAIANPVKSLKTE